MSGPRKMDPVAEEANWRNGVGEMNRGGHTGPPRQKPS